jgi:hypothetical protein
MHLLHIIYYLKKIQKFLVELKKKNISAKVALKILFPIFDLSAILSLNLKSNDVFQSYYEMGDKDMALSTMKNAFESHPQYVTSEGTFYM